MTTLAHEEQKQFCLSVKQKFPDFFRDKWVLDIGSFDINGNNQYLFTQCGYLGLDLLPGKNVDLVSTGHELQLPDATFDVIISTECFEHDQYYAKTITNIVRMLKPGGLFLFTCATTGRPEHGTRRTTPEDAPFTGAFGDWGDYYKNLEEADIRAVCDIEQFFSCFEFSSQHKTHDLYFWGVKHGVLPSRDDYSFHLPEAPLQRTYEALRRLEDEAAATASALHEERTHRGEAEARCLILQDRATWSEGRLSETETRLSETETRLSSTEMRLSETEMRLSATETHLTATENRLSEAQAQAARALHEERTQRVETEVRLTATETRLSEVQAQAMFAEEERRRIIGSNSWRITRPLRAAARLVRGQTTGFRK
ncbi:class I SAM-dependent methyltransferase [Candidatus Phycosocius spiralis]|uniref:Methyltransferase type 11 domain-containing protein n=1 Tax=Candidatus Phycosocius spiralis TaxID=2815099 RepID=A0ABQ4PT51_9PROT|nr:methyltransferase domain-containing protein [Candidatus Phycosocius spiralis]GIU65913.1 hypothetical protein PsB1_0067 [Candidatus Phycosocius spiralis]